MRFFRYSLLLVLTVSLVVGCSKKKEEAAKLEQEILDQDSAGQQMADTTAGMMADTTAPVLDASAVPEEEPAKEMPGQPEGSGLTVQVAGCEDLAYAEHLVELYADRGYEPYLMTSVIDGQTYHRVRIGLFDTWQGARSLQDELLNRYSIETWVDKVDSMF